MKIVNKQTFYKLPEGTLYSEYEPCTFFGLKVKKNTISTDEQPFDYNEQNLIGNIEANSSDHEFDILNAAEKNGTSIKLDFDCISRDGMFEDEELYGVYEQEDIDALIKTLKNCKGV